VQAGDVCGGSRWKLGCQPGDRAVILKAAQGGVGAGEFLEEPPSKAINQEDDDLAVVLRQSGQDLWRERDGGGLRPASGG